MVVEVERIDAGLRMQARATEAALDGALFARIQFHVRQPLQGGCRAEILGGGFRKSRLQLTAHRRQTQLLQFLFQGSHGFPFRGQE